MTDAEKAVQAAQEELEAVTSSSPVSTTEIIDGKGGTHPAGWTPELVGKLSLGIGVFAILSFALVTFLIWRQRSAEQILRTFGILVIIFAAVFLVIAGYSDTQITPVIGLLGTIAGYLLGRRIETPNVNEGQKSHG
jgi:hypothetical protein